MDTIDSLKVTDEFTVEEIGKEIEEFRNLGQTSLAGYGVLS